MKDSPEVDNKKMREKIVKLTTDNDVLRCKYEADKRVIEQLKNDKEHLKSEVERLNNAMNSLHEITSRNYKKV